MGLWLRVVSPKSLVVAHRTEGTISYESPPVPQLVIIAEVTHRANTPICGLVAGVRGEGTTSMQSPPACPWRSQFVRALSSIPLLPMNEDGTQSVGSTPSRFIGVSVGHTSSAIAAFSIVMGGGDVFARISAYR